MNDTGTPQRRGRLWPLLLTGACLFLAGAAAATVYTVCFKGSPREVPPDAAPPVVVGDISPKIHQFCGACHQYPPPDTFPRSAWRQEVERGYVFFENSSLHMRPPPLASRPSSWPTWATSRRRTASAAASSGCAARRTARTRRSPC